MAKHYNQLFSTNWIEKNILTSRKPKSNISSYLKACTTPKKFEIEPIDIWSPFCIHSLSSDPLNKLFISSSFFAIFSCSASTGFVKTIIPFSLKYDINPFPKLRQTAHEIQDLWWWACNLWIITWRAYFVVLVSGQENDCGGTHQINFISRANRLSRERKTIILLGAWEFRNPAHSWFWVLEYEL
jgi:hypothetical protein